MRVYWLLTALVPVLAFLAEWTRAVLKWLDVNTYVFGPRGAYRVTNTFSVARLFEAATATWRRDELVTQTFNLLIFWLAWPWLMLLSLQVFRASMRRAKVRADHVMRCVVYSFDVGAWLAMLSLAYAAYAIADSLFLAPTAAPAYPTELLVRGFGFLGVTMVVVTWRMTQAYRRYMGFDHALATIIAAQVITMLLVLNWIGFWANFGPH